MNILVATHDSMQPITGGGALRTLKTAQEFKRRGHSVIIVAPSTGATELNGMSIEGIPGPSKQRSQILSSIKFNIRLVCKYLKFVGWAEMFFVHNTIAAAALLVLKPFCSFRLALDITDIHAEYLLTGKRTLLETLLTPLLLFIEYRIINLADTVTVESKAMKNVLVAHGISCTKVEVVYDGADIEDIPREKAPGFFFNIIHLGLIDKQHGVDILVRALPQVLVRFPQVICFFVGDGRELPNLKQIAKELSVFDNCVFTGQLPCQDARQHLKSANIGIIPRRDNLPNRIVTTLKIFEYWASGTCVIASRLEAITEISSENENIIYFREGDPSDLAEKIICLLSSPERFETLRVNGISTARKYSWDQLIPKIADKALNNHYVQSPR